MSQPPLLARIGAAITTTRRFVTNALFVIISIIILMAILSSLASPTVPRGAALVIDPAGYIVEERSLTDPLSALLLPGGVAAEATLRDIVRAIRSAVDDDGISMLVFDFNELLALSAVQAVEIGRAVDAFRATGREAIVYGYTYSQSVYLAASYADAVYMHPAGQLLLPGYGTSQPYLGEMFDKLKVKMHVFRAGEFKDAVEPFTASEMSDASREANQQLVDALWHHFSQKISENRVLEPERLRHYTHKLDDVLGATGGDLARAALEYGLVDELLTADQMNARVRETTGSAPYAPYLGIDYRSYLATLPGTARPADNVGLVVVDGPILMNDVNGTASADTITALIRQGREDPSIDAIVLRVDSPGGGSFASELIRQELELTQLAGKPVVASFAGVAASGGYWIASTSDRIVTEPVSITGSIGVFIMAPTFEDALANLGVHSDGVRTSPLTGGIDPMGGLSAPISRILQASVNSSYDQFVTLVARGRDMAVAEVDEVAQGRIWTGRQALDHGLADKLGGLNTALAEAAQLADISNYGVKVLSTPSTARDLLLQELLALSPAPRTRRNPLVLHLERLWREAASFDDPRHTYAICAYCPQTD